MIVIKARKSLLSGKGPIDLLIDLELRQGEILALSGPSGSGKTSLLRILAGLLQPEEGYIEVDGQCWLDTRRSINWPSRKRNIGLVFQDYALFPHFNVRQNLQYALGKDQDKSHLQDLIAVMELHELLDRKPGGLSGGQQQRVALARALVRKPALLLLDEPLSALDPDMRRRLQAYILRVHQAFSLTTILVSHDQTEVRRMAGRALLIRDGQLQAPPVSLTPQNRGAASLRLSGRITSLRRQGSEYLLRIEVLGQLVDLSVPVSYGPLQEGQEIQLETDHWQLLNQNHE